MFPLRILKIITTKCLIQTTWVVSGDVNVDEIKDLVMSILKNGKVQK